MQRCWEVCRTLQLKEQESSAYKSCHHDLSAERYRPRVYMFSMDAVLRVTNNTYIALRISARQHEYYIDSIVGLRLA